VLVVEALRAESAKALHANLAGMPPRRFNAFHLLYADASDAFVTWSDGEAIHQETLRPGLHVVTERSLGGDDHGRTDALRRRWVELGAGRAFDPDALAALMRAHDDRDPVAAPCLHVPMLEYGTRSSLLFALGEPVTTSRFLWADASPCSTPYVEQHDLVAALRA
jgi:hypothetical protein